MSFLVELTGASNPRRTAALLFAFGVVEAIAFWALGRCDRRRAPGYDWGEGKLRME